jgi:hypothetical protein
MTQITIQNSILKAQGDGEASRCITDNWFRRAKNGLTIEELLHDDPRLANHSPHEFRTMMNTLEDDKLVYSEYVEGRGRVYRLLVFETFEDLCRAKTTGGSTRL